MKSTGNSSPVPSPRAASDGGMNQCAAVIAAEFQMPLHYPKYSKSDYETMPEWKLDRLLDEYSLPKRGDVNQKKRFAMGAFLWPDQSQD
ncbi:hypothetical protein F511_27552 [Dorcoceras hygrometricum]|uniref:DUF7722 domain-containing protein n=1 Tax=Dorcoceras hygrometricum TaxID=472368 RepID=A0A2Z7D7X3_9LAMI|nr:hypothetical protein F511_27552 [Dorcoceras hygrometricum]